MRFELLIDRLAKQKRLRSMIEGTTNLPVDQLIESLVTEFEQVVERYKSLSAFAGRAQELVSLKLSTGSSAPPSTEDGSLENRDKDDSFAQPLKIQPIKILLPGLDLKQIEQKRGARAEEERRKQANAELENVERQIHEVIERDWGSRAGDVEGKVAQLKNSQQILRSEPAPTTVKEEPREPLIPLEAQPTGMTISDEDLLYLHAAGLSASTENESGVSVKENLNGIDEDTPMLTFTQAGVRLFVSKIQSEKLSVTRSGLLLLGKEDSHRYAEMHETILNEIRCEDFILPFEFGSIVTGEELSQMAAILQPSLSTAVGAEERSGVWALKLFALDSRVNRWVGERSPAFKTQAKTQEKGRSTSVSSKRADVKSLERMLHHERSIAESVHSILTSMSTSGNVDVLVSIESGTSDDWKPILEASYNVPLINRSKFFSTILDLQQEYRKMGLLFAVNGVAGRFSVRADAGVHHSTTA